MYVCHSGDVTLFIEIQWLNVMKIITFLKYQYTVTVNAYDDWQTSKNARSRELRLNTNTTKNVRRRPLARLYNMTAQFSAKMENRVHRTRYAAPMADTICSSASNFRIMFVSWNLLSLAFYCKTSMAYRCWVKWTHCQVWSLWGYCGTFAGAICWSLTF